MSTILIASAVLVTTQMVLVRYFFKMNTVWQTEYVIHSLAAATFIGAPYVLLKKGHVNDRRPLCFIKKRACKR